MLLVKVYISWLLPREWLRIIFFLMLSLVLQVLGR